MQQFFKKIVLIVLLAGFQGSFASEHQSDPELNAAKYDVFMKSLMYKSGQDVYYRFVNCVEVELIYRQANMFGIARKEIADLARNAAVELHDKLKKSNRDWTDEEIQALANAIKIRYLVLYCSNR